MSAPADDVPGFGAPDTPADLIEIRLLGPLQVRRANGTLVHPREWRTGKTVDLLRILALRSGRAVSVGELVDALWPDVDESKGRVSLRNALAQLRRVLGQASVERRPDGLVLRDAWVDSAALMSLAAEARRHAREGRLATAVRVAREADALHLGVLRASDPDALWVDPEREAIEATARDLLMDAAEQAVQLGWMRDGLELARRALDADSTSERAYRALMRAYAGLGETERALREYERCRAVLAEELGIDPSPQTRALHVELLSVEPLDPVAAPMVGRDRELADLVGEIRSGFATRRPGVVYVGGGPGSGKTRLVAEAARQLGLELVTCADGASDLRSRVRVALSGPASTPWSGLEDAAAHADGAVVLVPDAGSIAPAQRQDLLTALATTQGRLTVVLLVFGSARTLLERDLGAAGVPTAPAVPLQLLPLTPEALEQLATALLAGPVAPQLLAELATQTDGVPGQVTATIAAWSLAGRVAATAGGLILVEPHDSAAPGPEVSSLLARAMEQLDATDLDVLPMVALLDRSVRPTLLVPLLAPERGEAPGVDVVRASLDRLVDLQLLVAGESGYAVRDPLLRQAVASWLRPSTRRRLHGHIALLAHIPAKERVRHWRAAGESELASAASLDAARDAGAVGDWATARSHLFVVVDLATRLDTPDADLAGILEQLGDGCAALGRADEAAEHYQRSRALHRGHDAVAEDRVAHKLQRLDSVHSRDAGDVATDGRPRPLAHTEPVEEAGTEDVEELMRAAVTDADSRGDREASVGARLRLVESSLLPGRLLTQARTMTSEALSLAGDGPSAAAAAALHYLPDVLLGSARSAEGAVDAALAAAPAGHPGTDRLELLRCLVGHDLGHGDFSQRWARVRDGRPDVADGDDWTWARVRMLTERGSLADALEADRTTPIPTAPPLVRQLRHLATAGLLVALGRGPEAVQVLLTAIKDADDEGCTLLLPEVTARLVILRAESEPETALKHFELFDWVAGSHIGHPREGYLRLLARSAIRAGQGQLDRAAAAAANAARIAEDSGLLLLASEAYLAQAQHLFAGGWAPGARLATASAARCLRAAGTAG